MPGTVLEAGSGYKTKTCQHVITVCRRDGTYTSKHVACVMSGIGGPMKMTKDELRMVEIEVPVDRGWL